MFYFLVTLIFMNIGFAQVDPNNTYQFNRENHFAENGMVQQAPWFEWWYYKVVLPEQNKSFYFVYGVVNPWDDTATLSASRSYVEMGSFADQLIINNKYSVKDFSAAYEKTSIQVGTDNKATDKYFQGQVQNEMGDRTAWKIAIKKQWSFNATGPATGKNITQIEWYPAQADARCSGEVIVNGAVYQFKNAPCYQDRNWGSQFPDWWAWVVANDFINNSNTSLAIGGGRTTFNNTGVKVEGFAIGLKHKGREYQWKPYVGDLVTYQVNFGKWDFLAINKTHMIKISGFAPREKFMDLQFTTPQGKIFHDYEALHAELKVEIYRHKSLLNPVWVLDEVLYSQHAGLEYGSFAELK